MKKLSVLNITTIALAAVINILGAQIALLLKLPVYLDTIGTIFTAALLGPVYGILPGLLSGLITGLTTDIYSLYFSPVQIVTGIAAGIMFKTKFMKKWSLPIGALFITIPGTLVASLISAFLFGGVTSSGSSLIVMFLRSIGVNEIISVFVVQVITDFIDRSIAIGLVIVIIAALPKYLLGRLKGDAYGSIQ